MKLHNVGMVQAFHYADFFLERFERVGCRRTEGAAASTALCNLSKGASAYFDGEESSAIVFAQFHLRWKVRERAGTRRNIGHSGYDYSNTVLEHGVARGMVQRDGCAGMKTSAKGC
jgi:hypothetical protein